MEFYNKNFKRFRESKELTHREIADMLKISKQAIQAWEAGKSKPTPSNVKKAAKILDCSVIDISDLAPEKPLRGNKHDKLTEYLIEEMLNLSSEQKGKLVTFIERLKEEGTPKSAT